MKTPFLSKDKAEEIAKKYGTPYHVYDEAGIRRNAEGVNSAFSWNKGFKEYFAVKATPNPFILKLFKDYGMGLDCSSMAELKMAYAAGFSGEDIMFSSNDTPAEDYVYAAKIGALINFDDITMLPYYLENVGEFPETVSLRYNPGGTFSISNDIMDNPGDSKYGMTEEQMEEACRTLKEHGVKHFGIHAFLASNTVTDEYYPTLAGQLFKLAVSLKEKCEIHIAFINLSGGVGIPYRPDQEPNHIDRIGEGVKKEFEKILIPADMKDVKIFTEMGRYMMGPYGSLVTRAIHEKHIYKEYIGVDACAANLMRPAMYGAYHHLTVLGKEDNEADCMYDVTGSLCENNDKFAIDRMLPKIEMGDLIYIHDTGAHGFAMGYNYNGRLWSPEVMLHEDGSFSLIRRAQTLKDYFATFDCFDEFKDMEEV